MAYSVLQAISAALSDGGHTTQTLQFANNVSTGNKMIVRAQVGGGGNTASSVKDNLGNAFFKISAVNSPGSDGEGSFWALTVVAGLNGTKPTITLTLASSNGESAMAQEEVSGLNTANDATQLDGNVGTSTGMGSGTLTVTGTTTTAVAEMLCVAHGDNGTSATITAGSGFTKDTGDDPTSVATAVLEHKNSTNGAETGTVSASGGAAWELIMCAFKLSAAGPASPLQARGRVVRTTTPRSRAQVATVSPFVPSTPLKARQKLVPQTPTARSRTKLIRVVVVATPLLARGKLIPSTPALKARAKVAQAGPLPATPLTIRQKLLAATLIVRSRARVAQAGPLPGQPLTIRQKLLAATAALRSRAKVAQTGPLPATPLVARQRLLPRTPSFRSRAILATFVPTLVLLARGKLLGPTPTSRNRAKVAGAGPLPATPLTARQKLAPQTPSLRSRARVATPVVSILQKARGRLLGPAATPRSRARVAGAGPAAARSLRAVQRLLGGFPRIRGALNTILQLFRVPTFGPGVCLVRDFQLNACRVSDRPMAQCIVRDFQLPASFAQDRLI